MAFAARQAAGATLWPSPADSGDGEPSPYPWDASEPVGEPYASPESYSPYTPWTIDTVPAPNQSANVNARLLALLALIRQFESNDRYNVLYGGGTFTDFSRHPNVRVPFHNPRKNAPGNNDVSTAAGAYQINYPTYSDFAPRLTLRDFTPATQDAIAVAILRQTGAYNALVDNDIERAINLAASRWASLPGSTALQSPRSMNTALAAFEQALSSYA